MDQRLPFTISIRPWVELLEKERDFFRFSGVGTPLRPEHAAQIALLIPSDAVRLTSWLFAAMPEGWPTRTFREFEAKDILPIHGYWGDPARIAEVKRWLFNRGIPFRRVVYLIYEPDRVAQTTWRMVVRYWDTFAWPVGNAMVAVDHTLQWACQFHHEDVITFSGHGERRQTGRRA